MNKKRYWRGVSAKVAKDKTIIYNSKEWQELRIAKLRANPLCEECMKEGIVTAARCVHHVVPIETAKTKDEMRRLAINCGLQGLKSLCFACHARIHKELGSNTAKIVRQRAEARQDRWKDNLLKRFTKQPQDNGTGTMETDSGVQR
jgi:5-methylcytosine-specific restriction protein A